ncbi:MAG: ABC transporter ATP-binding protein [Desulfohalobiaceae bacterium]|nr:ABC transporter ATP-binding protein [Desulfohalobiaceae bacterium]
MNERYVYEIEDLFKEVQGPKTALTILQDISFKVAKEGSLAIVGASGSGKTTLLHLMGGLDTQTRGKIVFNGRDLSSFSPTEKADFRNRKVGFVFQFHHLLPEFNTLENVAMPCLIQGHSRKEVQGRAREMLKLVGLQDQEKQPVSTLSGGERQLAAIARALVQKPEVVLADEPTGNLDAENQKRVGSLLVRLNRVLRTTLVVVTHNLELAELMQDRIQLRAGGVLQ